MVLEKEQGHLFYRLWLPLLNHANEKYQVVESFFGPDPSKGILPDRAVRVADKIWKNVSIIDEYMEIYSEEMTEDELNIIAGWKDFVRGTFVVERHLRKGSILVSANNDKTVYLVKGIFSDWRELLGDLPMPQMVEATLIPFQGEIIHDGLMRPYGICLRKSLADEVRNVYLEAKANDRIHTCIGDDK